MYYLKNICMKSKRTPWVKVEKVGWSRGRDNNLEIRSFMKFDFDIT